MIDNRFRSFLPQVTGRLISFYQWVGLSPNVVTLLGCFIGLFSAVLIYQKLFLPAVFVWWIGRLLDGTDGIYARHLEKSSRFGAFLDINCDMLAYSAVILAFSLVWPMHAALWLVVMMLYVLCISGALSLGSLEGGQEATSNRKLSLAAGLAEGGETGIFYSICLLFPSNVQLWAQIWICVLIITVLARFILAFRVLRENRSNVG